MEVSLLNQRIAFERAVTRTDAIGNRKAAWEPHYECAATVSGEGGREAFAAGSVEDKAEVAFTVRDCAKAREVGPTGFRIAFAGERYGIVSVDHLSYAKRAVKFRCRKERRGDG